MVRAVAATHGATPGQVALAFLLARQPWIVPIPGTTKLHRLEENLAAVDLTLDDQELDRLSSASDRIESTAPATLTPSKHRRTCELYGTRSSSFVPDVSGWEEAR